jgi:hypothetical protein
MPFHLSVLTPGRQEVARVGLLESGSSALGEAKSRLWSLAPLSVMGLRGSHVQIMDMHPNDPQDATCLCQIAADDFLEIENTSEPPRFEVRRLEQIHFHEDGYGRNHLTLGTEGGDSPNDARVVPVLPIVL